MLTQLSIMKDYAMDLNYKLETMGEKVRDAYNFYNDTEEKWARQKEREVARVLDTEYQTLQRVYWDLIDRISLMERLERKQIGEYVLNLLERLEVGDKLSCNFSRGKDSIHYFGRVTKIVNTTAIVENETEMELFDALAYPQVMDVNLERVWYYSITKKDGTEIYA